MVAGMSKPDTPETYTTTQTRARLGQQDLIALALAEKLRRRQVRTALGIGAWAVIADPVLVDQIGEAIVRITEVRGSSRVVTAFFNGSSAMVLVDKLKPCLASGDIAAKGGHKYVVLDLYPRRVGHDSELAWGMSPQWGIHGAASDEPHVDEIDVRDVASETTAEPRMPSINPHVFADHAAYVVRGYALPGVAIGSVWPVGPGLSITDFAHVASCAEPCRTRKNATGRTVDDHVEGRRAILCDFLGGATLWIWAENLVQCLHTVQWDDSPSASHHPETTRICMPSSQVAAAAAAVDTKPAVPETPELPAAPITPVLALTEIDMSTTDKIIRNITSGPKLARGTIVIIDAEYAAAMEEGVGALRMRFSDNALDSTDARDAIDSIRLEEPPVGAYEVRRSDVIELPDGSTFVRVTCVQAGSSDGERYEFISALVRVAAGGALAVPASTDGAVARVAKTVGGKALDVAKDAFVGAKDMVVDEAQRKALALAQVASQDTLVAGHAMVRRTVLAAGAGLVGADNPQAAATNAVLAQGFDMMSIGAGKLLARVLAKHAPGTAKMIDAATDSLQQGIDQKQAHDVLDQVMPVVGGGLKALAQAAVVRMMPALPAAPTAPVAALPITTPTPVETPAKPKRKRTPKATQQSGGAK